MQINKKLLNLFAKQMFADQDLKLKGKVFKLEKTKDGLRNYKIGDLLLIEQNPKKKSYYSWFVKNRAAKIMWVINIKTDKYLWRVLNGKVDSLS